MEALANNILAFCNTVRPYSYLLAIIAALSVGIMLAIPNQKAHDFAKSYGPIAIFGTVLIAGCVTLGQWLGGLWSF